MSKKGNSRSSLLSGALARAFQPDAIASAAVRLHILDGNRFRVLLSQSVEQGMTRTTHWKALGETKARRDLATRGDSL
jgi:hypothetical protein